MAEDVDIILIGQNQLISTSTFSLVRKTDGKWKFEELTNNGSKDEHTNQITHNGKNIPEKRKSL